MIPDTLVSGKKSKIFYFQNHYKTLLNISSLKECKVVILAFLKSEEGKRQDLLDLLLPHVEPSRNEEGNISYVLNSSIENPNEFLFDEVWSNRQTCDKHYNKPDSYRIRQEVTDLLAEPLKIKTYVEIKGN